MVAAVTELALAIMATIRGKPGPLLTGTAPKYVTCMKTFNELGKDS